MPAKKKVTKKKAIKKPVAKKKASVKKATKKKAPVTSVPPKAPLTQTPQVGMTDSNGDPIGGKVLQHEAAPTEAPAKPSKTPKGTEIDTTKGGVSIKAKKTAAEAKDPEAKKSYTVVMRGGIPTKVEDDGDDI